MATRCASWAFLPETVAYRQPFPCGCDSAFAFQQSKDANQRTPLRANGRRRQPKAVVRRGASGHYPGLNQVLRSDTKVGTAPASRGISGFRTTGYPATPAAAGMLQKAHLGMNRHLAGDPRRRRLRKVDGRELRRRRGVQVISAPDGSYRRGAFDNPRLRGRNRSIVNESSSRWEARSKARRLQHPVPRDRHVHHRPHRNGRRHVIVRPHRPQRNGIAVSSLRRIYRLTVSVL
jgi:hypothetical protein